MRFSMHGEIVRRGILALLLSAVVALAGCGGSTSSAAATGGSLDVGSGVLSPEPEPAGESELGVSNGSFLIHDGRLYFVWEQVLRPSEEDGTRSRVASCLPDGTDLRVEEDADVRFFRLYDAGDRYVADGLSGSKADIVSLGYDGSDAVPISLSNGADVSRPRVCGGTAYFTRWTFDEGELRYRYELWACDVASGEAAPVFDLGESWPSVPPMDEVLAVADGTAYLACGASPGSTSVWAVPVEGEGGAREVAAGAACACVAGGRLVVADASGALWSYALDGGDGRGVAALDVAPDANPTIVNANSQYVYVAIDGDGAGLLRVDLATGELLAMDVGVGAGGSLDIIGDAIYYTCGDGEIVRCGLDGGDREAVLSQR